MPCKNLTIRDRSSFVDQDRFGAAENPPGQRGNCLQACLASVLGLSLHVVPHFADTDEAADLQHAAMQRWLADQGWVALWVPWAWKDSGWMVWPRNALGIVSGKSPRGEFAHVVLGCLTELGWDLVHDPHPSKAGLDGTPYGVHLLAQMPFVVGLR